MNDVESNASSPALTKLVALFKRRALPRRIAISQMTLDLIKTQQTPALAPASQFLNLRVEIVLDNTLALGDYKIIES